MSSKSEAVLVNAQDAVSIWANDEMLGNELDPNNVHYEINWSRTKIQHTGADFKEFPKDPSGNVVIRSPPPPLFKSLFTNNGKKAQQHKVNVKRGAASCHVQLHSGVSGLPRSFLPMPTPVEAAHPSSRLILEDDEVRLQDTLEWQVENIITVDRGENLEARMQSTEKRWNGQFQVITSLRGTVDIAVFENGKLVHSLQGNIARIFEHAKNTDDDQEPTFASISVEEWNPKVDEKKRKVKFYSKGVMEFSYYVDHVTTVNPISSDPLWYQKTCCDYLGGLCKCCCNFFCCGCCTD